MRYTLKYSDNHYHSNIVPPFPGSREAEHFSSQRILNDKLGQLEDIEEELSIDLITLFKALTNGVYRKTKNGIVYYAPTSLQLIKRKEWYLYHLSYTHLKLKDYGKTWALTKEELL